LTRGTGSTLHNFIIASTNSTFTENKIAKKSRQWQSGMFKEAARMFSYLSGA
jgi:hypothetical protein